MKRIILSLSLIVAVGVSSAFAEPANEPSYRAQQIFKKEFSGARSVQWFEQSGYQRASFLIGGQRAEAWFSYEGELLGSVRDIFYNQLPLVVMRSLDKRFEGAAVLDIREVSKPEGTKYLLTLEFKEKKYKVSVLPDGYFDDIEKVKK